MTFHSDIRHWPDIAAFRAHLAKHDPKACTLWAQPRGLPRRVQGIVIHHTWRPTWDQWRGERTLIGIEGYYIGKGWTAGPHLFLAPDGLWQLTPLNMRGVHAGWYNADYYGLEVAGDYDAAPWLPTTRQMVYDTIIALEQWSGIRLDVCGHREVGSPKSCPGRAIDMHGVRVDVARLRGGG